MKISTARTLLAAFLGLIALSIDLSAQRRFPHLFTLDARSADTLATPDATSSRHRYRVTAWGTYSMWEDTVNSSVDPVWIYSFPDEEWAKPEWRLFPEGYPIYVGDARMYDSHGLRVNNKPFPKLDFNDATHRYSMIVQGNGQPVTTSIVDWNFRDLMKRDAHDNNSGALYVLVEELPLTEVEICAVDTSRFPNVRVSMKVLRDSVSYEDLGDVLSLRENGAAVQIDSVDCSERTSRVSIGMVFDRSGSMQEQWGGSTRMTEVKSAGRRFVSRLGELDEAAIFSFAEGVTLDQTWTNDKSLLNAAIDRLRADGYTAMNDGILRAIDDIESRPDDFEKAIVVLSDGEDNRSQVEAISDVIARANQVGVPVFAIGLLLENDDSLRLLTERTGGQYFPVTDASAIDSVFQGIASIVFEKGCCSVWYTSPDARRNGTWRPVDATVSFENDTTLTMADGYVAPSGTSDVQRVEGKSGISIRLAPNPAASSATLRVESARSGTARVDLLDPVGRVVTSLGAVRLQQGESTLQIDLSTLPSGRYFLRTIVAGEAHLQAIDVVR